jgi:hypothetical protein
MVKWHPPGGAGRGGAKGVFKAAESFLRWARRHGLGASPTAALPHRRGFPIHPTGINRQKQDGHIRGTPQWLNRRRANKPTSTWNGDRKYADSHTYEAWAKGTPHPRDPWKRDYDFGDEAVGYSWHHQPQTRVRVHIDEDGSIHGHPS